MNDTKTVGDPSRDVFIGASRLMTVTLAEYFTKSTDYDMREFGKDFLQVLRMREPWTAVENLAWRLSDEVPEDSLYFDVVSYVIRAAEHINSGFPITTQDVFEVQESYKEIQRFVGGR